MIRTGKSDFGQSTATTAYRQMVAEELRVSFDAITSVVMGDTDRTPDGGGTFGLLGGGAPNIRKAAAYTYQALLGLASTRLGVPVDQLVSLKVKDATLDDLLTAVFAGTGLSVERTDGKIVIHPK